MSTLPIRYETGRHLLFSVDILSVEDAITKREAILGVKAGSCWGTRFRLYVWQ